MKHDYLLRVTQRRGDIFEVNLHKTRCETEAEARCSAAEAYPDGIITNIYMGTWSQQMLRDEYDDVLNLLQMLIHSTFLDDRAADLLQKAHDIVALDSLNPLNPGE